MIAEYREAGEGELWLASLTPHVSDSVLTGYLDRVGGPVWVDDEGQPTLAALDAELYDLWVIDGDGVVRARYPNFIAMNYDAQLRVLLDDLL